MSRTAAAANYWCDGPEAAVHFCKQGETSICVSQPDFVVALPRWHKDERHGCRKTTKGVPYLFKKALGLLFLLQPLCCWTNKTRWNPRLSALVRRHCHTFTECRSKISCCARKGAGRGLCNTNRGSKSADRDFVGKQTTSARHCSSHHAIELVCVLQPRDLVNLVVGAPLPLSRVVLPERHEGLVREIPGALG